jgi:uncharacterized damage-inducible protein DinB
VEVMAPAARGEATPSVQPDCQPALAAAALGDLLRQLSRLLASLTPSQYTAQPLSVFSSAVGGHVRHSLDHIAAFLDGVESGRIDYDQRRRGTPVEQRRDAALAAIERLEQRVQRVTSADLDRPLQVALMVTADGARIETRSSVGRELGFVLSHTVHHNSTIGSIATMAGVDVPDDFGYAPATLAHLQSTCAPSRSSP